MTRVLRHLAAAPLVLILGVCVALAQTASVEQGNILFRAGPSAAARRLTNTALDSEPDVSLNGRLVTFVRDTPQLTVVGPTGDDHPATEIWVVGADGTSPRMLVRGGETKNSNGVPLGTFSSPRFAPDGTHIYFLTQAAVVQGAVYSVDLATRKLREVCVGNLLQVIRKGEYAGDLVVEQHRLLMGGGAYYWVYVLTPDGRQLGTLGEQGDAGFDDRLGEVLGE
jgi:hypothetical protein